MIGGSYREGSNFGHGKGDLEESSPHVLGSQLGEDLVNRQFLENPDSTAVEIVPYYELDVAGKRLDLLALDENGEIVVAVAVEPINNDWYEAIPNDFDKMASVDPKEAIWIVMNRREAHKVIDALWNPPDGVPCVSKTYSENTPPEQFTYDEPGLTAMYTAEHLRNTLYDEV